MFDPKIYAFTFTAFMALVVIFQLALALGAPWGELAMGGNFQARFPLKMRMVALFQIIYLVFMILIVLTRSDLAFDHYFDLSKSAIWFVVVICVIATITNLITPSKKERNLWAPVSIVLLVCSVMVAIN